MAIRGIRIFGDAILRAVAEPVAAFDDSIQSLAQDLLETLDQPGRAGVAAPQIGVPLRAFSYGVEDKRGVLINPEIVTREGSQEGDEGCLSVPGLWYPTTRSAYVVAKGYDSAGEPVEVAGEGELARCLEHEVDHLAGIVYLHRLDRETRKRAMRDVRDSAWFATGSSPAGQVH